MINIQQNYNTLVVENDNKFNLTNYKIHNA